MIILIIMKCIHLVQRQTDKHTYIVQYNTMQSPKLTTQTQNNTFDISYCIIVRYIKKPCHEAQYIPVAD